MSPLLDDTIEKHMDGIYDSIEIQIDTCLYNKLIYLKLNQLFIWQLFKLGNSYRDSIYFLKITELCFIMDISASVNILLIMNNTSCRDFIIK